MRFSNFIILVSSLVTVTSAITANTTIVSRTPSNDPPPYIWEPNSVVCQVEYGWWPGLSYFFLDVKGDWTGHDWGRALHEKIKSECTFLSSVDQWQFEYYHGTGDYHNPKSRNYSEPGSGPAWAKFRTKVESRFCVERAIRRLSVPTGQIWTECEIVKKLPNP